MLHPDAIPPKTRRHLSFDPLVRRIRLRAKQLPDPRNPADCDYLMADAVMSAFALFSLKDPSLLAFEKRRYDENIKNLFRVRNVPSDTQMRTILDPLEPDLLRPMFNDVFRQLQRGKALEPYAFHEGCYLLSMDGTGYFSSKKIHCESCLQKKNRKTDEITYQHQMLAAAVVHPDHRQVIPLALQHGCCPAGCRLPAYACLPAIEQKTPSRLQQLNCDERTSVMINRSNVAAVN